MKQNKNQDGLASIVIVGVLVILLALITLGFSKIMNRAVNNSLNNQLSAAANYAAQSAINDVMAYIKGQPNPEDVSSSDCTTLLKEPGLSNLVDLSGDGNTKITCILVNPRPSDLMYQQLAPNGSQIIKATTSDVIDKVMVSWQASNGQNNSLPGALSFSDVPTWNSAGYAPMVKVSFYPVPSNGKISGIQDNAKSFYLAPGNGAGTVTSIPYSTADGSVIQAACNAKNTGISGLTADYTCNAILTGLYTNIAPDSYYYVTLTPIYNQADVKIKALNSQNQAVQFINVQTVIDATAKANNAAKRLQERVDSNTNGDNIAATDNAAPGFAIRSAKALCKQLELHKSYYDYILNDAPNTCNSGASGIPTVAPTLTLSITGNNGSDSGVTRDSATATPASSGYNGVVYVNSAATVNWKSTDAAYSCDASGGWSGNKNDISSWSGVTGTGSQAFSGLSNYTTYNLICKGPGGTTPTKTVTAWPPPRVSMSGPGSVNAGDSYTINWSGANVDHCTMSSTGNANWDQTYNGLSPTGAGDSKSFGTDWRDHSTKIYTIKCWDPIGRSDTASWKVSQGSGNTNVVGPRCSATASFSGHTTNTAVITWSASCPEVDPSGGGNNYYIDTDVPGIGSGYTSGANRSGNVRITSSGSYHFRIYTWAPSWKTDSDASSYGSTSGDGLANSGMKNITVNPPLRITNFSATGGAQDGIWDQGPNQCSYVVDNQPPYSPSNPQYGKHAEWPDGTWWCRNGRFPDPNGSHEPYSSPGCPDGVHKWTTCNINWSTTGGWGSISCEAWLIGTSDPHITFASGGGYKDTGRLGWNNQGLIKGFLRLSCSDQDGESDSASY